MSAALEGALGAAPPAGVAALPATEHERLAAMITAERERHVAELEGAADRALRLVPAVLRGTVKRIVFS